MPCTSAAPALNNSEPHQSVEKSRLAMENGIVYDEMDVDLDIDLGPLDSGEPQVSSWIGTSCELVAPDTSLTRCPIRQCPRRSILLEMAPKE